MRADQMREEWENVQGDGDGFTAAQDEVRPEWAEKIRIFTMADCENLRLEPIVRNLLFRKLTTIITSRGGLGKSRAVVQGVVESSLGRAVWGQPDFTTTSPPPRWLVIFGEDPVELITSVIRPPLRHYGLQEAPFVSLCADDLPNGDLTLTAANVSFLVDIVKANQIDAVAIDTLISILPEMRIIDPPQVRRWLKGTVGRLQRETGVGVLLVAHEAASGNLVSGALDWQNFARLVLHLEHKKEGLTLTPGKDNLGFPFTKLRLERNPETLITTVIVADRRVDGGCDRTGDVNKVLTQIMQLNILPLPVEQRNRRAVEPLLHENVKGNGITRAAVRDFLDSRVRWEDQKRGRTTAKIAVGFHDAAVEGGGS